MAVNQTKSQNGQLFLNNDYVIIDKDGVEFSFENSRNLPGYLLTERKGRLILTGQRIIFVNSKLNDQCQTITMAFHYIRNLEIKQPIFGANYLQADLTAEPGAGWQGDAVFKVTFSKGGAIEFAEAFQRAVRNARAARHPAMAQPAMNGQYFMPTPQPAPVNGYYGYPAGGYPAPPPYQPQPYPPPYAGTPQYNQYQANAPQPPATNGKAAEAYASGQNVYVPAPQGNQYAPPSAPPPYDNNGKKNL